MATALATEQLTKRKRTRGQNPDYCPLSLQEVAGALQATRERTLRRDCLESRDRAYRYCVRKVFGEGSLTFRTSITQAAAGMGYPVSGDREDDEIRFAKSVRRCLNDLQAAGLIQWGGVKRPDGRWRCIEVCMPDSKAKAQGAPARSGGHNHHYRALRQLIQAHLLWAGITQAFASVLVLTVATAFAARPLGYPPAELCYVLAGIGVAILLGYVIEAVWMVARAKHDKWHENWLGFVCGLGLTGLLGIALGLAVGAHRESGHGNLFDDVGIWWSFSSLALLGLLVVLHPFLVDRWRDD